VEVFHYFLLLRPVAGLLVCQSVWAADPVPVVEHQSAPLAAVLGPVFSVVSAAEEVMWVAAVSHLVPPLAVVPTVLAGSAVQVEDRVIPLVLAEQLAEPESVAAAQRWAPTVVERLA
jgi:hypothetical protein